MMKSRCNILIVNPRQVGSQVVETYLKSNIFEPPHINLNLYKSHTYSKIDRDKLPPQEVDIVILIYRDTIDRHLSCFLHTLHHPNQPHYFGSLETIKNSPTQTLLNHFKKYNWSKYMWANYDYYIDYLNCYFGIPLKEFKNFIYSPLKYYRLEILKYKNPTTCLFLKLNEINDGLEELSGIIHEKFSYWNKLKKIQDKKNKKFLKRNRKNKVCIDLQTVSSASEIRSSLTDTSAENKEIIQSDPSLSPKIALDREAYIVRFNRLKKQFYQSYN